MKQRTKYKESVNKLKAKPNGCDDTLICSLQRGRKCKNIQKSSVPQREASTDQPEDA